MRFKTLLLAAALATALPLTVQAKTFRWSRSVDISAIRKSGLKRDQSSPASIMRMSVEMSAP